MNDRNLRENARQWFRQTLSDIKREASQDDELPDGKKSKKSPARIASEEFRLFNEKFRDKKEIKREQISDNE